MPEYLDRIFRHSRLSLSTHSCLFLSSYRSILLHAFLLFNQLHVLLRLCKEILHQSILFKRQGSSSHDVLNLRSHHRIGQCAAHHHEYTGAQHILKVIYNELPDVVVHLLHKTLRDGQWVNVDSAEVIHGHFKMKGRADSVMMVTLYMDHEGIMPLVLEDGKIVVSISNTQLIAKGKGAENIKASMNEANAAVESALPEKYKGMVKNEDQDR